MADHRGIDVSEYQGVIDWRKVRAGGVTFAMLRCGYGRFESQKDDRFEENYKAATEAGVHVGAYLFSYALTEEQAKQEAETCLRWIAGKRFDYPIAYDVETRAHQRLATEKLSAVVRAFCETLEAHGYYVSIYTNLAFLRNGLSKHVRERYDVWLAQWASKPTYTGAFGMWQYSATGTAPGIAGTVDLDVAYKDYPAIMRKYGLNGYRRSARERAETPRAGQHVKLTHEPLYSSPTSPYRTAHVSGDYFVYAVPAVDGRYPLTNRPGRVGKKPARLHITGWVDENALL